MVRKLAYTVRTAGFFMAALCAGASVRPGCFPFACGKALVKRRPGQTTVEYLLMLGVVAAMAVIMVILFHKKLLGGIFTLAGLIIGAGTPK